jgi:cyclophilin family peptidyl-prolyl cis-trans isomerase
MPSDKRARQRANREQGRTQAETAKKSAQRRRATLYYGVAGVLVVLVVVIGALIASSGGDDDDTDDVATDTGSTVVDDSATTTVAGETTTTVAADAPCTPPAERPTYTAEPELTIDESKTYTATLSVVSGDVSGDVVIELDVAAAPHAVNNFVTLANDGFYDCTLFHRIVQGFVVQGGDPTGTGSGGPGYQFDAELPTEETGAYPQGAVAMANSAGDPNTQGSQFFIVTGDASSLPSDYTRFGTVTSGLELAQSLEQFGSAEGAGTTSQPVYLVTATITES